MSIVFLGAVHTVTVTVKSQQHIHSVMSSFHFFRCLELRTCYLLVTCWWWIIEALAYSRLISLKYSSSLFYISMSIYSYTGRPKIKLTYRNESTCCQNRQQIKARRHKKSQWKLIRVSVQHSDTKQRVTTDVRRFPYCLSCWRGRRLRLLIIFFSGSNGWSTVHVIRCEALSQTTTDRLQQTVHWS